MNQYDAFYTEKLYPFQDGVLNIVRKSGLPFYLTGGTALSRGYFQHRYSDDLDFFVNNSTVYPDLVGKCIGLLTENQGTYGFRVDAQTIRRTATFSQVLLTSLKDECLLKIDLVNDIAFRVGDVAEHETLGALDTWENILSNKCAALYRFEPKDIADIWCISRNRRFSWAQILHDAKEKDGGIEPMAIAEILSTFPKDMVSVIKWTNAPEVESFISDLKRISTALLSGRENIPPLSG